MNIIRHKHNLQQHCQELKHQGLTLGFVPTMGALHEGHLSLVDTAKAHADNVIASIFVNPAQFAAHEDLDTYPRTEEADIAALESRGIDSIYIPSLADIYPDSCDVRISTGELGQDLDGWARPHFFDGVALVVTKLLMQTMADVAVFGEKDFQQLTIIKRLVKQLDIPTTIIGSKTIREDDGLAYSSRNRYLNTDERAVAGQLNRIITDGMALLDQGTTPKQTVLACSKALLTAGFSEVDYVEIRLASDLKTVDTIIKNTAYRILVAARVGTTRLIDNMHYQKG